MVASSQKANTRYKEENGVITYIFKKSSWEDYKTKQKQKSLLWA